MRVCVLEDEKIVADKLCSFIEKYCAEQGVRVEVQVFPDAFALLEGYHADVDILFMDIQLPVMNGMEAAKKYAKRTKKFLLFLLPTSRNTLWKVMM